MSEVIINTIVAAIYGCSVEDSVKEMSDEILAALREKYAIVELPKPDEGEWSIQDVGNVAIYDGDGTPLPAGGVRLTNIGHDLICHANEARSLAAALLAAADTAAAATEVGSE